MSNGESLSKHEDKGVVDHLERGASHIDSKSPVTHEALALAAAAEHGLSAFGAIKKYHAAFLWCMFINIGALLWGYDAQIGGAVLSIPSFRRDFGYTVDGASILPAKWQSAFNCVTGVGGLFGGLIVGWLSDRIGRRWTVTVACVVSIGAVFIQFFCPPHLNGLFVVGKLINGCALGMYVTSASGYCSEVSPLALRGITTGAVSLWITVGQFVSNCVIEGVGQRGDKYAYRIPFGLQWIFPLILLTGMFFAPESPWYLVRQGKLEAAHAVLARLGKSSDADLRLRQIQDTIEFEEQMAASSSFFDCFRGANRRRTTIALMCFICQQAAGVVFVLGYSSYFFQLAGFATSKSFKLGVGVAAIGIAGNLFSLVFVNRVGRRPGFVGGMVILTVINFIIAFSSLADTGASRWAQAAFTIIYNFFYQVSIGPIGYIIFAEVGSAKLRSKTVGIGICVNSVAGVVFNVVIPYMINPDEGNLKGKVGFVFGGLGGLATVWTYFFIPETKNRTIDELDQLFEARVSPRKFSKTDLDDIAVSA